MFALLARLAIIGAQGVRPKVEKVKRDLFAALVAGFCFLVALVAAIVAAWIFLAEVIGAGWAGLVIAAAAILIGAITLAVVSLINHREARRRAVLQASTLAATDPLTLGAMGSLPKMLKVNPVIGVLAVGALTFLFARSRMDRD
ncbi:hypothetical protein [Rhizobium paknamense]|uniref:Threonine dehydrogenase-like Zn-dependent dehydrogenase n=1 Tax=Rhizobium paknamense TaxID=1206817 RepID=A0ABU0IDK6_9HYPH|nr:hypothetical protein [Rhizobium paknamense]MDQ0456310.1 threonine dehydrogenase-like Zn-dependent dehydrogenase [Rhizobium paknamense]